MGREVDVGCVSLNLLSLQSPNVSSDWVASSLMPAYRPD